MQLPWNDILTIAAGFAVYDLVTNGVRRFTKDSLADVKERLSVIEAKLNRISKDIDDSDANVRASLASEARRERNHAIQ